MAPQLVDIYMDYERVEVVVYVDIRFAMFTFNPPARGRRRSARRPDVFSLTIAVLGENQLDA